MSNESRMFDVIVAGGGPIGLAFACSLSRLAAASDLKIGLVERQSEDALRRPAFDGREIAVTHRSQMLLRELGAWERLPAEDIQPLREARVRNGTGERPLRFDPPGEGGGVLGHLVPNHRIREAIFAETAAADRLELMTGAAVDSVRDEPDATVVSLQDGRSLRTRLLVAADSRFSRIRTMRGIGAATRSFGKTMMVCRVAHDEDHEQTAVEWFGYGQTMAMLPLRGRMSSAVVTLPPAEIEALMAMDEEAFGDALTRRYDGRLGRMRLASTRHVYPLTSVYADRFVSRRFALLGDAAVGMHPVTAHGFNLGLQGQHLLATALAGALARGAGVADPGALLHYEREHRRATRPLYLATNTTAMLYTNDSRPARMLRDAALFCGGLPPIRRTIVAHLMERDRSGPPDHTASAAR
ncbi:ubiquinone biosynthesis UbiH/UbiF/VisC/COQ6 family hydroxylase [Constrictibacter sp. MBR-5]|jgi:ubiquinone biosynthesis UbiH/UbiF/VisC/COQ6 family hydroxylase|uniref:5-demethoxyubiquinol-8 5-hydroxylase UbiM n=1 Tax=Constrictibacter sp. MBR-5 TaxID=3156467 RepID=UPI003393E799